MVITLPESHLGIKPDENALTGFRNKGYQPSPPDYLLMSTRKYLRTSESRESVFWIVAPAPTITVP